MNMRMMIIVGLVFFFCITETTIAALRSTLFYRFDDTLNITIPYNVKGGSRVDIYMNGLSAGNARLVYQDCGGFDYSHGIYWSEYFTVAAIPASINIEGNIIPIIVQSFPNMTLLGKDDNYIYYINGFSWDSPNGSGVVCPQYNDTLYDGWGIGRPEIYFYAPANIKKKHYDISLPFFRGVQRSNYDYIGGRYKPQISYLKTITPSKMNIAFNSDGGCNSLSGTYEINHKNISIANALNNYAETSVSLSCDFAANVSIRLVSNTSSDNSISDFNVKLGNGWDSIISLDGKNTNNMNLKWNGAGTKTIKLGSKLYGSPDKISAGNISGSLTMIITIN